MEISDLLLHAPDGHKGQGRTRLSQERPPGWQGPKSWGHLDRLVWAIIRELGQKWRSCGRKWHPCGMPVSAGSDLTQWTGPVVFLVLVVSSQIFGDINEPPQ